MLGAWCATLGQLPPRARLCQLGQPEIFGRGVGFVRGQCQGSGETLVVFYPNKFIPPSLLPLSGP